MFSGKKKGGRKYTTLGEEDDAPPTPNFSAFSIDDDEDDADDPPNPPLPTPSFNTGAPSSSIWTVYSALTFDWLRPLLDLGNSQEVRSVVESCSSPVLCRDLS